ncbi:hypothetical protein GCM10010527_54100 [Streptomyces drozdowiczii]
MPRDPAQLAAFINLRVLDPEHEHWLRGVEAAGIYHRLHGDLKVPFAYRVPPPTPTRAGLDLDPRYRARGGAQYVGMVHVAFGGRHHTAGAVLELAVTVLEDGTSWTTRCACSGAATARTRARHGTPGVIQAQASGPVRTANQTTRYG